MALFFSIHVLLLAQLSLLVSQPAAGAMFPLPRLDFTLRPKFQAYLTCVASLSTFGVELEANRHS